MTNKIKALAILTSLVGFATTVDAQSTATASTEATMIIPISIAKDVDLQFGVFGASATAGTVELATDATRTLDGGVTISPLSIDPTAAEFTVTGEPDHTFSISHETALTLTGDVTGTMEVTDLISSPAATGTLTLGTATILVGGTLNVGANQAAGVYTNASDLFVTVNYN